MCSVREIHGVHVYDLHCTIDISVKYLIAHAFLDYQVVPTTGGVVYKTENKIQVEQQLGGAQAANKEENKRQGYTV